MTSEVQKSENYMFPVFSAYLNSRYTAPRLICYRLACLRLARPREGGGLSSYQICFKKSIEKCRRVSIPSSYKLIIWGINGVAMACRGLILNDNEATGSRKVSRYLPGLQEVILNLKMAAKVQQSKNQVFYSILYITS